MAHTRQKPRTYPGAKGAIGGAGLAVGLLLLAACGATAPGGGAGQVTIAAGRAQYGVHDQVAVTITNGLANAILAADHQSNCTIVTIERQDGQNWQPQNPCLLKSATKLVTLAAGSRTPLQLDALAGSGASGWAAGTYRLTLTYRMSQSGADTTVTSTSFAIS